MSEMGIVRKKALDIWKKKSNRVFKTTDNFSGGIECVWQNMALDLGYKHISLFCSIGQFSSHITDLLRDFRYDKYSFDQSEEVNEIIFRYYSRIFLITSEILTDFQDLYILTKDKITTRQLGRIGGQNLREKQDLARSALSGNSRKIATLLDYINKICKHKTSNFHICNNHIGFLFEDFHKNIKQNRGRVELGNIKSFTLYDETTFVKNSKANYVVVPSLQSIIEIIVNGYAVIDNLFKLDATRFEYICEHFENK